ncbi:UNVERIFIED_CONTAM: hypothetical protein K2H54_055941 [Gekko kuhli]
MRGGENRRTEAEQARSRRCDDDSAMTSLRREPPSGFLGFGEAALAHSGAAAPGLEISERSLFPCLLT